MMTETQALLAEFVATGSEPAFRELVARYLDLVYSTALRLVDADAHRAEDVSQVVFADLAKMAGELSADTMLGGWLHRHTCFVARNVMRGERRRQARERQAAQMNALNDQAGSVLAQIAPVLDEAIQELGPDDRDAILLRFYERRNLRAVGEALGTNENVAQKRVARAVQELGVLLQRRGVVSSATALAGGLAAGAVTAAPAGLALKIAGTALAGAAVTGTVGMTSGKLALAASWKLALLGVALVGGVATMVFLQTRTSLALRDPQPQVLEAAAQPDPGASSVPLSLDEPQITTPAAAMAATGGRTGPQVAGAPQSDSDVPLPTRLAASSATTASNGPGLPTHRLGARQGSRLTIQGTSTIGAWRLTSSLIGGFLEVGPGFPSELGRTLQTDPVQARVEAFVPVRSLKSITIAGLPYSDAMDEVVHRALKSDPHARVRFVLSEMVLTGATNNNGVRHYQFDSRGYLALGGVTNEIALPVSISAMGDGGLVVFGQTGFKMTSFRVAPPASTTPQGYIRAGDDVTISFDWIVAPRSVQPAPGQQDLVPLKLELPAPAFTKLPPDLRLGPNVDVPSAMPRVPLLVPPGLTNLALFSLLTSSDANVSPDDLLKIANGDKCAAEGSIVYLGKGRQWVQMDFGMPQQVFAVVIWHAHNSAKVYHDVVVQMADDPEFAGHVSTLFDNDSDNSSGLGAGRDREYVETYEGKLVNAKGREAHCIRFYSRGSTESALNEYTEIEVYGRPAQ